MPTLISPYGEIEVRILKSPFDVNPPVVFQEYAKLSTRETDGETSTRYIVPEKTTYAIQIIVKEGYYFGDCLGLWVRIIDDATDTELYNECHPKAGEALHRIGENTVDGDEDDRTKEDQKILISTIRRIVFVDGEPKKDVELALNSLNIDETLDHESDVAGSLRKNIGKLTIKIAKDTLGKLIPKRDKDYQRELQSYQGMLVARARGLNQNTIGQAQAIDQKSYVKNGMTHSVILTGGVVTELRPPNRLYRKVEHPHDLLSFTFIFRSSDLFEVQQIVKAPIPNKLQPQDFLGEEERQKYYGKSQKHGKQPALEMPQAQTVCWNRGQTFSKSFNPGGLTSISSASRAALLISDQVSSSAPSGTSPTVKTELHDSGSVLRPIVIDDIPPPLSKRLASSLLSPQRRIMKSEVIDLDGPSTVSIAVRKASTIKHEPGRDAARKKLKLESDIPIQDIQDNDDLAKLENDARRQETEIEQTQRLVEMLRKNNETRAKIEALKAQKKRR